MGRYDNKQHPKSSEKARGKAQAMSKGMREGAFSRGLDRLMKLVGDDKKKKKKEEV